MRTTVTLDPDTESLVRRLMVERGISFKRALNDAIRAGSAAPVATGHVTRVRSMGAPRIDLDKTLQLAAELEDEELVRKMQVGK